MHESLNALNDSEKLREEKEGETEELEEVQQEEGEVCVRHWEWSDDKQKERSSRVTIYLI